MVDNITISLQGISKYGEGYTIRSKQPLTKQQIHELCKRYEDDNSIITDCGNNIYFCNVNRGKYDN